MRRAVLRKFEIMDVEILRRPLEDGADPGDDLGGLRLEVAEEARLVELRPFVIVGPLREVDGDRVEAEIPHLPVDEPRALLRFCLHAAIGQEGAHNDVVFEIEGQYLDEGGQGVGQPLAVAVVPGEDGQDPRGEFRGLRGVLQNLGGRREELVDENAERLAYLGYVYEVAEGGENTLQALASIGFCSAIARSMDSAKNSYDWVQDIATALMELASLPFSHPSRTPR